MLLLCPMTIILYLSVLLNLCHKSNLYVWIHTTSDFSGTVNSVKEKRMQPYILRILDLL